MTHRGSTSSDFDIKLVADCNSHQRKPPSGSAAVTSKSKVINTIKSMPTCISSCLNAYSASSLHGADDQVVTGTILLGSLWSKGCKYFPWCRLWLGCFVILSTYLIADGNWQIYTPQCFFFYFVESIFAIFWIIKKQIVLSIYTTLVNISVKRLRSKWDEKGPSTQQKSMVRNASIRDVCACVCLLVCEGSRYKVLIPGPTKLHT